MQKHVIELRHSQAPSNNLFERIDQITLLIKMIEEKSLINKSRRFRETLPKSELSISKQSTRLDDMVTLIVTLLNCHVDCECLLNWLHLSQKNATIEAIELNFIRSIA